MKAKVMSALCLTVALVGVAAARPEQAWRAGSDAEAAAANAAAGQKDSPPPPHAPQRGPQPAQQPPQQPPQHAPRPVPQQSAAPPPAQPPAAQPPRFGVPPGVPPGAARGDSDPARGRWSTGGQPPGTAPRLDLRRDDGRLDQARREEAWRAQQAQRGVDRRADDPRGGYRAGQPGQPGQPGWTGGRGAPPAHRDYSWRDYDRYRAQNFRFDNGRYLARSRYRMGDYYWPRGYSNDVWLIGAWLPAAFFLDTRYQLVEYWRYGLYEPPFGTHWIRVGADALLVDDFNGEVLDAIYDLFW